jgi:simple sugar transport system ATP-binding protein
MQQRSEILKALSHDAEVLMLDEPTAVLPPSEAAELLGWLRRFADAGHAVVLVTHRLRDALAVADDVTVLRRGRTVLTARAESLDEATLASAMIGEAAVTDAAPAHVPARARDTVPVVLSTRGVWCDDGDGRTRLRDVSLAVRGGEVVGVAGIEGEGAAELLRVLAGRREPSRGEVVRPALLGFVPEDRHRDAVLLDRPLTENLALRNAGSRRGRMHWGEVARRAESLVGAFDVRASGVEVAMRTLSGGNQQKFVLARELADTPSALVVENPTRGLDIRATEAVRLALRQARAAGTAVVVYSSDIDELLALADRVVVVAGGRVVEVPTDRDAIAQAMVASVATASP